METWQLIHRVPRLQTGFVPRGNRVAADRRRGGAKKGRPHEGPALNEEAYAMNRYGAWTGLVVHAAHATHAAAGAAGGSRLLLGAVGDHALGSEEQTGDRRGVLQRGAGDLGRIDDAGLHEVLVLAGGDVVAVGGLAADDLLDDDRSLDAGVGAELLEGGLDGATHDLGTELFVAFERRDDGGNGLAGAEEGDAAAGDYAFLDGRTGRVEGVFDALLLFLHLGFGRSADVDDGHAAGELGKALLELLAVVVGGGLVDLTTDLLHAGLDVGRLAGALDDGGVFLVNGDVLGAAEVGDLHVLKLDAEVLGDAAAAGEHGDVFKHGLAAVAEAGGL